MSRQFFVHSKGICDSEHIGDGTKIWEFTHVLAGAKIGKDCNVCAHVFIESDVVVGDRVTIKCGVQLWDGLRVANDVFIGPNATFVNDLFPRSKQYPEKYLQTHIGDRASIGANSTILGGIEIGEDAMVGAGAVVTKSVPPKAIVAGNPARIIGYADTQKVLLTSKTSTQRRLSATVDEADGGVSSLGVGDVAIQYYKEFEDLRGKLSVLEFHRDLPFVPKRLFFVYGVPSSEVRGEHAHIECNQFLIAVHGSLSVVVDNGTLSKETRLDSPTVGLFLPKKTWGIQYKFSPDAVLAVFASHLYESRRLYKKLLDFICLVRK